MTDSLPEFRLDGRVAWVAGGLGLIGRRISALFARAGATTIVLDNDEAGAERMLADLDLSNLEYHHLDLAVHSKMSEALRSLRDEFGTPHAFVNCSYPRTSDWGRSTFSEATVELLQTNLDLHLTSYIWSARVTAELMVEDRVGGSIVLFGSTYGVLGQDMTIYEGTPLAENMTYSAIKGGVVNYARLMASYYGRSGVRVNSLCPGGVFDGQNERFVKQYEKKTPLGRMAQPEEIAAAALFLASPASSYVTGATLMVDGGWSAV